MAVINETHLDSSSPVDFLLTKCDLDDRSVRHEKASAELRNKKIDLGMNMDSKKLFVGGLSWETTENLMKEYFSQFGNVRTCTIKIDKITGHSRGFGFVIFDRESDLDIVLAHPEHRLCNKRIDPKRAKPSQEPARKVFVGGLDPEFPESEIKEYFRKFGKILAIDLPFDYMKSRRKAFIFVTYAADSDARRAAEKEKQLIGGKWCDVRIVQPKPKLHQPRQSRVSTSALMSMAHPAASNRCYEQCGLAYQPAGFPHDYNQYYQQQYSNQYRGTGYDTARPYADQSHSSSTVTSESWFTETTGDPVLFAASSHHRPPPTMSDAMATSSQGDSGCQDGCDIGNSGISLAAPSLLSESQHRQQGGQTVRQSLKGPTSGQHMRRWNPYARKMRN